VTAAHKPLQQSPGAVVTCNDLLSLVCQVQRFQPIWIRFRLDEHGRRLSKLEGSRS
jgi:hypothetical protein